MLVLPPLVLAGVVFGISAAQPSTYAASSKVIINNPDAQGVFDAGAGVARDPQRAIQTEIEVILGQSVRKSAAKKVDDPAPVTARAIGVTDVVEITATSSDPKLAARTANAFAAAYISHRQGSSEQTLGVARKEIESTITELQSQITELDQKISAGGSIDQGALVERRNALITQQTQFSQRLDQLQVDATLQKSTVELVDSAETPTTPVSPQPLRNGLLAGAAGLLAAIAAAFAVDRLDDKVRTRSDVQRVAGTLPVLASMPEVAGKRAPEDTILIDTLPAGHPVAEAYRSLRTALEFLSVERDLTVIQVTSALSAEGKSTTVANLALALAGDGRTVAVICCDLRRPRLHKFFGVDNQVGLTSVLAGLTPLHEAIRQAPHAPRVSILPSGPVPPNPSELLSAPITTEVFKELRELADVVLVDTPPVLPVTDAAIVARYVDATVLIAAAGQTTVPHLGETVDRMRAIDAPLVGVVLNRVPASSSYGGYAYLPTDADSGEHPGLLSR